MSNITRRAIALQNARDKAQDPDFKLLWDMKLRELVRLAREGEPNDRI
jgi:hypothetical protein